MFLMGVTQTILHPQVSEILPLVLPQKAGFRRQEDTTLKWACPRLLTKGAMRSKCRQSQLLASPVNSRALLRSSSTWEPRDRDQSALGLAARPRLTGRPTSQRRVSNLRKQAGADWTLPSCRSCLWLSHPRHVIRLPDEKLLVRPISHPSTEGDLGISGCLSPPPSFSQTSTPFVAF
jgi:hypothetical protein